ncbi:MAG: hypothetical protein GC191_11075 [Azospirillum sp.]|nr:hypothetical protein [Azospirillum sp.]
MINDNKNRQPANLSSNSNKAAPFAALYRIAREGTVPEFEIGTVAPAATALISAKPLRAREDDTTGTELTGRAGAVNVGESRGRVDLPVVPNKIPRPLKLALVIRGRFVHNHSYTALFGRLAPSPIVPWCPARAADGVSRPRLAEALKA